MYKLICTNLDGLIIGTEVKDVQQLTKFLCNRVHFLKCGILKDILLLSNKRVILYQDREIVVGAKFICFSMKDNGDAQYSLDTRSKEQIEEFVCSLYEQHANVVDSYWYDIATGEQVNFYIRAKK